MDAKSCTRGKLTLPTYRQEYYVCAEITVQRALKLPAWCSAVVKKTKLAGKLRENQEENLAVML